MGVSKFFGIVSQAMRKKLPPPENTLSQPGPSQNANQEFLAPEDYVEQDEIFKVIFIEASSLTHRLHPLDTHRSCLVDICMDLTRGQ